MWLTNSSIGRKVIMSVTGIALILFLTFHACMNLVAIFSAEAYDAVCAALGANWYAVLGTLALAALVFIHFVYAVVLTLQNRKARGSNRYAVTDKPATVEWSSQNMFVLGVIVVLGLLLHLYNFWYNMMFQELLGEHVVMLGDTLVTPTSGAAIMAYTFGNPVFTVIYIVWFVAIWFHLTHGFWSALQTLGLNNKVWFNRWKVVGNAYVTILMLIFVVVALYFSFQGGCPFSGGCPL